MQVEEGRVDLDVGPASPVKDRGRRERRAARVARRSYAPVACGAYARLRALSGLPQALASALAWLSLAPMPVIPTNHGLQRVNPGLTLLVSHLTDIELTSTLTNIEDWLRATVPRRNRRLQFPHSDIAPSSPLMVRAGVISHQMLMTNDGAGKRHEGADRAPDARDRGEERSVQAICLRYRLLNRQGAGATGEDRQFDDATRPYAKRGRDRR